MAFSVFLVHALDNDIFSIHSTHFGSVASVHRTDLTLAYRFEYVNPHLRHYSISLKSPFLTSDHINFKLVDSQSAAMSFESENVNYASLAMNTETSELQLRVQQPKWNFATFPVLSPSLTPIFPIRINIMELLRGIRVYLDIVYF